MKKRRDHGEEGGKEVSIMRFSIVCGCEGWRYYQHANGAWVKIDDHEADLLALRETVRVLGEECKATRLERERFFDKSSHAAWAESVRLAGDAIMATNANPIAFAAVEKAG